MPEPTTALELASIVLGSSVVGGLVSAAITGLKDSASKRRDGYASAVKVLVARAEFPFRVRRRTSDDSDTLATLTRLGHDIQEQLAAARVWVSTESERVSAVYESALRQIDLEVRVATEDAWRQPAIDEPSAMNLGGWGPRKQNDYIAVFSEAVRWRFGWRRLIPCMPRRPASDRLA